MNRRFRVLGLSVAVFALGAFIAGAAQAVPFTGYDNTGKHVETVIHGAEDIDPEGNGKHVFKAGSGFGGITCTGTTFTGLSATGTDNRLTITPTYPHCTDSLGRVTDVTMNKCDYLFNEPVGSGATYAGTVDLVCEKGFSVVIQITNNSKVPICTVMVHAQSSLGSNHYLNLAGPPATITIKTDITNLQTTTSGGFFNCGILDGTHNDGSYVGNTTVTGKTTGGAALNVKVN